MVAYLNLHGRSGVIAYVAGPDFIDVTFRGGRVYKYSHASCGKATVTHMIALAKAGRGLATFISQQKPAHV
jgi:hypothetical protein